MSHIGKKPIPIPDGVVVEVSDGRVTVEGPKGKLDYISPKGISVNVKNKEIIVERKSDNRLYKSLHGLVRSLINNMVKGVTSGFQKTLIITGVGYRAQMKGEHHLILQLGFSHPVEFSPPPGIVL
ncbi:MAG: 50S ribosomal protein L6, partial [bacterium]|nr:50S ribosomal protein L6 [bacterium]